MSWKKCEQSAQKETHTCIPTHLTELLMKNLWFYDSYGHFLYWNTSTRRKANTPQKPNQNKTRNRERDKRKKCNYHPLTRTRLLSFWSRTRFSVIHATPSLLEAFWQKQDYSQHQQQQRRKCYLLVVQHPQQHASVSQGQICSDNCTCCHTEIEVADQTFHFIQSHSTLGAGIAQLAVLGLAVHSVAGSILLWGHFR